MSEIITNSCENIYLEKMSFYEISNINNIYSELDYSSDSDNSANSANSANSLDSPNSPNSLDSPNLTNSTNSLDSPKSVYLSDDTNESDFRNKVQNHRCTSEYTCELDKNNPFIDNLINKRINSCVVGPSSHIAAFLQNTVDIRSCFIPSRKRKGRNR